MMEISHEPSQHSSLRTVRTHEWMSIIILCYVNLINYMDRATIAGVLIKVQKHFHLDNSMGGFLQTCFVLSFMIFAPLFGYLGDRYNRRVIMACGVGLWSTGTLLGSFMDNFAMFLFCRGLVGMGEANYTAVSPTIISDLFVSKVRSKMLALFYLAIPVGSGLGYMVGSEVSKLAGSWRYALRVTPALALIGIILIIFVMKNPVISEHHETKTLKGDLKSLSANGSYLLSTAGFTCVTFAAGALAWWGPKVITFGIKMQGSGYMDEHLSMKFGAIAVVAGVLGLGLGCYLSQRWSVKWPKVDPIICGLGLFASVPLLIGVVYCSVWNSIVCFLFLLLGMTALSLNWAISTDILLNVVHPTRQSTAKGLQLLVSHAFGDAGSPYLIGLVSEVLRPLLHDVNKTTNSTNQAEDMQSITNEFHALSYALGIAFFIQILGGLFFIWNVWYIVEDKARVQNAL